MDTKNMKNIKKSNFIVAAFLIMFTLNCKAQDTSYARCSSMEVLSTKLIADPNYANVLTQIESQIQSIIAARHTARMSNPSKYTIPVVVHIVYKKDEQNISDANVYSQIETLNQDYRRLNSDASSTPSQFQSVASDVHIEFCLARKDENGNPTTGITRHKVSKKSYTHSSSDETSLKANGYWNSSYYLNIWVCNLAGGLLGYATFPGGTANIDGVVISYKYFGNTSDARFGKGRTATHEVGHWLNLRHIWGDDNCGDDFVSDTPTQETSNDSCPTFPHVTCSNGPNGDMFMNYMDYMDDNCANMFTSGQGARMEAAILASRASILNSNGCDCCNDNVLYQNTQDLPDVTTSKDYIKAGNDVGLTAPTGDVIVKNGQNISFRANNTIELEPGFSTESGAIFNAEISDCTPNTNALSDNIKVVSIPSLVDKCSNSTYLINVSGTLSYIITVYDLIGQLVYSNSGFCNSSYTSIWNISSVSTGMYYIELELIGCNTSKSFKYYLNVQASNCRFASSNTSQSQVDSLQLIPEINGSKSINDDYIPNTSIRIFPNPTTDNISFIYYNKLSKQVSIEIINMQGQTLERLTLCSQCEKGIIKSYMNTEKLSSGTYYLKFIGDKEQISEKFIVVRK